MAGAQVYAEVINTATYAASSGNWEFFDLALRIGRFMPAAMTLGAIEGVFTPSYLNAIMKTGMVGRLAEGIFTYVYGKLEENLNKYLLEGISGYPAGDGFGGILVDIAAHNWISHWAHDIGITPDNMQEYHDWDSRTD